MFVLQAIIISMKRRAKISFRILATAITLFGPCSIMAAEAPAHVHSPAASEPEKKDSLVNSATRTLIESFGELSRTAAKLSDTALKLLEAQESIESNKSEPKQTVNKAVAKKEKTEKDSDNSLSQIAEEISVISQELTGTSSISDKQTVVAAQKAIPEESEADEKSEVVVYEEVVATEVESLQPVFPDPELVPETREGGKFLWVPEENIPVVEALINGEKILDGEIKTIVDLNEKTLWRGDSIPLAIPTKRLGRFDRKLYNWLIYPKGLWHFGLSANYGELSTEDSEFLSLIQDVDLKGTIYSIKPSVSYFIRNNVCVGMRLAFTKGDMGINSFKVDIDEDMSFNLHDIKYSSDSYAAAVFIQQYFGLSRRSRFAVFNEAELSVGMGSNHFIRPFDGELKDTRTKTQSFNINYSPGVSIMVMKNAAFNLSFGVLGFHLKNEKQWENGEESGSRFTSGVQFRFNIFNINLGVAIII